MQQVTFLPNFFLIREMSMDKSKKMTWLKVEKYLVKGIALKKTRCCVWLEMYNTGKRNLLPCRNCMNRAGTKYKSIGTGVLLLRDRSSHRLTVICA